MQILHKGNIYINTAILFNIDQLGLLAEGPTTKFYLYPIDSYGIKGIKGIKESGGEWRGLNSLLIFDFLVEVRCRRRLLGMFSKNHS